MLQINSKIPTGAEKKKHNLLTFLESIYLTSELFAVNRCQSVRKLLIPSGILIFFYHLCLMFLTCVLASPANEPLRIKDIQTATELSCALYMNVLYPKYNHPLGEVVRPDKLAVLQTAGFPL